MLSEKEKDAYYMCGRSARLNGDPESEGREAFSGEKLSAWLDGWKAADKKLLEDLGDDDTRPIMTNLHEEI